MVRPLQVGEEESWKALMRKHHYLGYLPLVGETLRYVGEERTTHIYLHADLELKQRAMDRTIPPDGHPGRCLAPDRLLAFLEDLRPGSVVCRIIRHGEGDKRALHCRASDPQRPRPMRWHLQGSGRSVGRGEWSPRY